MTDKSMLELVENLRRDEELVWCEAAIALENASRVQSELVRAVEYAAAAEKLAAEHGQDTTEHTGRLRSAEDALRVGQYRLNKLTEVKEECRLLMISAGESVLNELLLLQAETCAA